MKFAEIDLLGVYVAPIFVMMLATWLITIALRRLASRYGLMSLVWHPPAFVIAVYLTVLSSIVLCAAR
jgi:hypothetical protein